jgi:type II secretory pathway pseudopilin PulG
MTLVELIVAGAISVMLLALVASLFIRTIQTQQVVDSAAANANEAKLAFDDMQSSVRLAVQTDVRSSTNMTAVPTGGRGDVLVVKSRRNEGAVTDRGTWRCVAWHLASDGKLHRFVVAPVPASGVAPARASAPADWPVVASGVTAGGGQPPFRALDVSPSVPAWYPGSVTLDLTFRAGEGKIPVGLQSTIAPRRQLLDAGVTPGGVPCV